jgi:hypothetical protein
MTITPSQGFLDVLANMVSAYLKEAVAKAKKKVAERRGEADHSIVESVVERKAKLIPMPPALIEKRGPRKNKGTHGHGTGEARKLHPEHIKTSSGQKVVFKSGSYGESPFYIVEPQGRTIVITYNRDHRFWRVFEEHLSDPKVVAVVDYIVFALADTELMLQDQVEKVKTQMNAVLVATLS